MKLLLIVTDPISAYGTESDRKKKEEEKKIGERRGKERDHERRGRERGSERKQSEGEKVSVDNEGETQTDRREERAVAVAFSHSAALH